MRYSALFLMCILCNSMASGMLKYIQGCWSLCDWDEQPESAPCLQLIDRQQAVHQEFDTFFMEQFSLLQTPSLAQQKEICHNIERMVLDLSQKDSSFDISTRRYTFLLFGKYNCVEIVLRYHAGFVALWLMDVYGIKPNKCTWDLCKRLVTEQSNLVALINYIIFNSTEPIDFDDELETMLIHYSDLKNVLYENGYIPKKIDSFLDVGLIGIIHNATHENRLLWLFRNGFITFYPHVSTSLAIAAYNLPKYQLVYDNYSDFPELFDEAYKFVNQGMDQFPCLYYVMRRACIKDIKHDFEGLCEVDFSQQPGQHVYSLFVGCLTAGNFAALATYLNGSFREQYPELFAGIVIRLQKRVFHCKCQLAGLVLSRLFAHETKLVQCVRARIFTDIIIKVNQ